MKTSNYWLPTPVKMRKIGDAILIGSAAISGTLMTSPLSDTQKMWGVWICSVLGIFGKVMTNLFKDEEATNPS